jgi:hypothetical protein
MKVKAEKRNRKRTGNTKWNPKTGDLVLVKCQTFSEAAQGITAKFQLIYEGPYIISKLISPSIYELTEVTGKIRGIFNKSHIKPHISKSGGQSLKKKGQRKIWILIDFRHKFKCLNGDG